ncbi:MAG TPA: hypothetical protein PLJ47_16580 [Candidatus Hydrogenedentes bacterium]|nr:hypothetical protein [Candidatus Hydrogenedentota bacterium]
MSTRNRDLIWSIACALLLCSAAIAEPRVTAFDDDGTITVNGARTFIIGTYMVGNQYTAPEPTPALYEELAQSGFNLVQAGPAQMDAAHAAGLMTWTGVGVIDPADPENSARALTERVKAVAKHPSVAFLETSDEPAWTWLKAEPRITADVFAKSYPIIKAADSNHLLYTNHAPTNLVSTLKAYNAGTDIVAVDIYPVNPGGLKPQYALFEDGLQGDLNNTYLSQVGEYCDKMRTVAGPNRPVFMVLQAFAWEMLREEKERDAAKVLYPSFEQSRFMAWQSIIRGANGIIYWGSRYTPQPSDCWTGITRVTREIADLSPIIVARTPAIQPEITYHELGRSVDDGIQWLVKSQGDSVYLFTCNADKNPCRATISIPGDWSTCLVLGENRSLSVSTASFTDDWAPFSVHLYELKR